METHNGIAKEIWEQRSRVSSQKTPFTDLIEMAGEVDQIQITIQNEGDVFLVSIRTKGNPGYNFFIEETVENPINEEYFKKMPAKLISALFCRILENKHNFF